MSVWGIPPVAMAVGRSRRQGPGAGFWVSVLSSGLISLFGGLVMEINLPLLLLLLRGLPVLFGNLVLQRLLLLLLDLLLTLQRLRLLDTVLLLDCRVEVQQSLFVGAYRLSE